VDGPDTGHVVYFVRAGDWMKVGYSKDVYARVRELQVGNPYPVDIVFTLGFAERAEALRAETAWFKDLSAHTARRGEWLRLESFRPLPRKPMTVGELIALESSNRDVLDDALRSRGFRVPSPTYGRAAQ
jgi:predicted GIY-YIG superfamily endonuclease